MKPVDPELLLVAVAQALETMAFIAAEPPLDDAGVPGELTITLPFAGAVNGALALRASASLGARIAANLAVIEPEAVTLQAATDALRELTNITAGLLLREPCEPAEMPRLAIPTASSEPDSSGPVCRALLSANGENLSVALRIDS